MNWIMNTLAYPLVMCEDTNGALPVTFPDIPEAASSAHDPSQALRGAHAA